MKEVILYSIRFVNLVKPDSIVGEVCPEATVTVAAHPSMPMASVLSGFAAKHKRVNPIEIIQIGLCEFWDVIEKETA